MDKVYKVKGQERYVIWMADYTNGKLTTGGLYQEEDLELYTDPVIGITYNADCCTELPVNWPQMRWLDDNNKRQFIKEINHNTECPFIMEDGYRSREVTG